MKLERSKFLPPLKMVWASIPVRRIHPIHMIHCATLHNNLLLDPKQIGPIQLLHSGFASLQNMEDTELSAASNVLQTITATIGLKLLKKL
jgi:hypothetical protein